MTTLNVQIVPWAPPEGIVVPDGAAIVQLAAREGQGAEEPCERCNGSGNLPRGDSCRGCGGTGKARFVRALRLDVEEPNYEQIGKWLASLRETGLAGAKVQRTVRLHESGGGRTNTGDARVVCGLNGEPLRPVLRGFHSCGVHAMYYVHAALTVSYDRHWSNGTGEVHLVGVDRAAEVGVYRKKIFAFTGENVSAGEGWEVHDPTSKCDFPLEAAKAVVAKSRCYHCREAHYTV
jgi:hypothetical protein